MTITNNVVESDESSIKKPSAFRRILPQVIVTVIGNLHMIEWGLVSGVTMIMIPALFGVSNEQNKDEFLSITGAQTSWVVSISYLFKIFGSLLSGVVTDSIGRKFSMIFINLPFIVGWFLLYQSTQIWHIFLGLSVLGLAIGLTESSVMTYVGEVCEPSTRGVLIAYNGIDFTARGLIIFILNACMAWRSVALVCMLLPIICGILLCFVPESPQWLLSKKRTEKAEKSLRWLRGWTKKEVVAKEFHELQRHSERSNACYPCIKQETQCQHPPPTLVEKLSEMKRKPTLKPFVIIAALFFLCQFTGAYATRPFMAQILDAYESPIPVDNAIMILGFIDSIARVVFVSSIHFTGKRLFTITMLCGVFISSFLISCYGFIHLPKGFTSFGFQNKSTHLDNPNLAYVPLILIFVRNFCSFCGFSSMPWMMSSELFPFKSRAIASGFVASLNYILAFISQKTYYNFEMVLSMAGTSLLYSMVSGIGLISMYFIFPETEGLTLEDIELHFADNSKKLTDRKISKKTTKDVIARGETPTIPSYKNPIFIYPRIHESQQENKE